MQVCVCVRVQMCVCVCVSADVANMSHLVEVSPEDKSQYSQKWGGQVSYKNVQGVFLKMRVQVKSKQKIPQNI